MTAYVETRPSFWGLGGVQREDRNVRSVKNEARGPGWSGCRFDAGGGNGGSGATILARVILLSGSVQREASWPLATAEREGESPCG